MEQVQRHVTKVLQADAAGVALAAQVLRAGEVVAFPTETVYGLGGSALSDAAVAKIYAAKDRPSFNPLILHVASLAEAEQLAMFSDTALVLARRFWPGPLTIVLPVRAGSGVSSLVRAGLDSVALRVPAHPVALELLRAAGPLAAPSANPSGRISATSAQHVIKGLDGRIAAVLDGGPCDVGVESTIIGMVDAPTLLRPGGLAREDIEALIGPLAAAEAGKVSAPGQLVSHYAPHLPVRLNAVSAEPGEVLLGFGELAGDLNLSASGNLGEAAANLFWMLHELDARVADAIAVAPVPDHGLGHAINDRLTRAAAERG
ncbi:MAG: L-threonylcarbamoyladenylate synthase [Deltaproteobacteria bacterium]